MSGRVTVPSVSDGRDLFPVQDHYPDYHVEWVPTQQGNTNWEVFIDLSIEIDRGETISLLIFNSNQDMQFAEVSRVLGETQLPRQVQQDFVANMSFLLGHRDLRIMDGTTNSGYFRVIITCYAGSIDLDLVPDDEEDGPSFDQMNIENSFDHDRDATRGIDLNVEPGNDEWEIESGEPFDILLDLTELVADIDTDIDNDHHIEEVHMMNNRDIEAADHQYHDHELPQYPFSSSADHDTLNNDDYFVLEEWLEMETDDDGFGPIEDELYRSLFESMETYEATTKPASKSAIEKLEKVRLESVEAARHAGLCAVCMEDFEAGNEATRLPCLHLYHGHCVVPWLEINHRCPLCRFPMPLGETSN